MKMLRQRERDRAESRMRRAQCRDHGKMQLLERGLKKLFNEDVSDIMKSFLALP